MQKYKKSIKYFIGYDDDDYYYYYYFIRPLCIKLPQMIGYVKYFHSSKTMSFKITDKKLLKIILKYGKKSAI